MQPNEKSRFLRARKKVIEMDFEGLNSKQLQAVMATEGPLLVLAGAGSGKTTVLIQRIANLIKYGRASDTDEIPPDITSSDLEFLESYIKSPSPGQRRTAEALCALDPVPPWSVLAITFTNKAANELKERLIAKLGDTALDVWASTFHSACVRILRRDIERLGYNSSFTIYDSDDSERLIKDVLSDLNLEEKTFTPKSVLKYISIAKDRMVSPGDYEKAFPEMSSYYSSNIAKAYAEYQRRLKSANALDFDDIILLTVTLLLRFEDVRDYYQRKFRYVLIDEYQDTNNLQYLLATILSGYWNNICVVGDDDQSIYRFRGATIENILSFDKQQRNCRVIKLEQNYRSTAYILTAANGVIENNVGRKGKSLWTCNEQGDKVTVYTADSEADEAQFVAKKIIEGYTRGDKFSDYAVLYRINALSNRIEDALKRNGIPYRIIGGTRFFDRTEVKDMLAYLHVIRNPADDLRLVRIINNPPRGIGDRTVEILAYLAQSKGKSIFDIVSDAASYEQLARKSADLRAFAEMMMQFRELSDTLPLPDLYDHILERSGYLSHWQHRSETDETALTRIENILELKSNIISYTGQAGEPTLAGFLDEVSLFTDIDNYDSDADSVVLMTIHSAKGLEFPSVFLVGLEEGVFPGFRSIGFPEELEEERRLCYVGITRARDALYVTHAKSRMLFGHTSYNRISRFVDEIPTECVDRIRSELLSMSGIFKSVEYSASDKSSYESRDGSRYEPYGYVKKPKAVHSAAPSGSTGPELPDLKKGDMITHKAFGEGMVVKITPMGGDALIEVAFSEGTKKLMLKAAAKFITKH